MTDKLICPLCNKSLKIHQESWPYVFFWVECNSKNHTVYMYRKTTKGLIKAWGKAFGAKND